MKITIVIEDHANGNVKLDMQPSAETLLKKIASEGQERLTPAETYALACVNRVREISKAAGSRTRILVPRLGRH